MMILSERAIPLSKEKIMNFKLGAAVIAATLSSIVSAKAADLKLWRLDCGSILVKDLGMFSDTGDYAGKSRTLTDSCYLIKHDNDYMMWDAGLPAALLGAPQGDGAMAPTLKATLETQLETLGVKPAQISLLGISHYHFDHVGQAAVMSKAKLLIGAADFAAFKQVPLPFGADASLVKPWLDGKQEVETVSGDKDVFGDGSVTMLSAPGHTPGSYALLVKLPKSGSVLLSGDVVHFEEQFANDGVPPFNTDRADTLASLDRIERLARNLKATLVVQHDADDVSKLPAFPAAAE